MDSKTALERLQRRRENHNFVERRRRDNINHTITTLSTLIPYCSEEGVKLNKGSILHMAVEYIRDLQDINKVLSEENIQLGGNGNTELSALRPNRQPYSGTSSKKGSANRSRASSAAGNSGLDTAMHSANEEEGSTAEEDEEEDEEDEESMPLMMSSGIIATETKPKARKRHNDSKNSGNTRAVVTASGNGTPMMLSPMPTAAPSAATSPMGLTAQASNNTYHRALPAMTHLPPPANNHALNQKTKNPKNCGRSPLPPIEAVAPQAPSTAVRNDSSHRQILIAQSVPTSPNFHPYKGYPHPKQHQQQQAINTHPFFNNDVSSIRHHLQVSPTTNNNGPHFRQPTQSLQSTPQMRPSTSRHYQTGDGGHFELPPISFPSPAQNRQMYHWARREM